MIHYIQVILLVLLAAQSALSKSNAEFPLWGSTWIIADGSNKRIYPSVLPLIPTEVAIVKFVNAPNDLDKNIVIKWANLNYKDYWGTAEVIKDIENQVSSKTLTVRYDSINKRQGIDIAYQTYNDTVWSLNKSVIDSFTNGVYTYAEKIQGSAEKTFDRLHNGIKLLQDEIDSGTGYTKEKPTVWLRRYKNENDRQDFTFEIEDEDAGKTYFYRQSNAGDAKTMTENLNDGSDLDIKSISNLDAGGEEITEYCDNEFYYKKISTYDYKTANLGYWQVHIYPEVWYYPRDFTTGKPVIHEDLRVTFDTAAARKSQSINNPDNNDMKYWRDPYLSDSASTIISFAFIEDGNMTERESICLSGSAIGSKIAFEHFPKKMYNVGKFGNNEYAIHKAAEMLYCNGDNEENLARTIEVRCPGWAVYDEYNGKDLFPLDKRKNGIYERDWNADDGIYRYDNCPCSRDASFGNKTKAQIRKFILKPVPTCQFDDMSYALGFYQRMKNVLTAPQDQMIIENKIAEVNAIMKRRTDNYITILKSRNISVNQSVMNTAYDSEFRIREQNCPNSWVDVIRGMGL